MAFHLLFAPAAFFATAALARVEQQGEVIVISAEGYTAEIATADGSLLSVREPGREAGVVRSGEDGLWRIRFRGGSEVSARQFAAGSAQRAFMWEREADDAGLRLAYRGPEAAVNVSVLARPHELELRAEIAPRNGVVLELALPGRLCFDLGRLMRLVCPMNGNASVGAAFLPQFFQQQPADRPSSWHPVSGPGSAGYIALFGSPLDQRPDQDPTTTLAVTPEGKRWLGDDLSARMNGAKAVVNRPSTRGQVDLVLVDSPNGPYFAASHLGGQGLLWRIGGGVGEAERQNVKDMVAAALERLAGSPGEGRTAIGLLSLTNGPAAGGWTVVSVREWLGKLQGLGPVAAGKLRLVELRTPQEMMAALRSGEYVAILNPYGEWTPVAEGGMAGTVEAVGRYVRSGGNWFEVGGYPFFYELRPSRFLSYATPYPAGFADFLHLDTADGSASLFGVQPQTWEPWEGARNHDAIFVPGRLACGGDAQGGWCERAFATFVAAGDTWRSPAVRLRMGDTVSDALAEYCRANAIARRLEDKMAPEVLDRFKRSVTVYYGGTAWEKIAHLPLLPVPTLLHFADYLKGGFDKQYPDHLPPHPDFGTAEELRAFFDKAHELGHLVMPYTNPTWWCDHPRGPTFEREGEAPLLHNLDGALSYERYGQNDGYTVCHWHPAVQAANRKTLRQFTDDYPVDVLFEDQCGARGWLYDTNPSSPTPYAYTDGLVSMVAEDCRTKPLSTEAGWDRVVNYESQLCGMSWALVPGDSPGRTLMKHEFPPATWEVFPLAQYIAHDKAAMIHHDLGQFVTNRQVVAWTLGLGFCMSYSIAATALPKDAPREWLRWLDRLQNSVCARYVGQPVVAFAHDRGPQPTLEDDGVLRAQYGDVTVAANLGPQTRPEGGRVLAPHGFVATAPGMVAANLARVGDTDCGGEGISFVTEGDGRAADVWVYAPAGQQVCVEMPKGMAGKVRVQFDGTAPTDARVSYGTLALRLPAIPDKPGAVPPPELAGKAPRDWQGAKPAIAILDFGPGMAPIWTRITPAQWYEAFAASRLAREMGVAVERIGSLAQLQAALQAGPTRFLAIINPYGEGFPTAGPGRGQEMLAAIREYVNRGGCWWETAGYSFYTAFFSEDGRWSTEYLGPSGAGALGLPVGGGEVDQAPESLAITPDGRRWLGEELSARVAQQMSIVNRGMLRGNEDPGHVALVSGAVQDFIGGYRLDGWGWLWRVGGFWPNPDVVLPVAVAAMEHIHNHPPLPVRAGGVKYLWHAAVRAVGP